MLKNLLKIAAAALIFSSATVVAADNPFTHFKPVNSGYDLAMSESDDAKCGAGKCGGDKGEAKCGAGKCGGDAKAKDAKCGAGKCGGDAKAKDAKCGAGKCGGDSKGKDAKCGAGKCGGK